MAFKASVTFRETKELLRRAGKPDDTYDWDTFIRFRCAVCFEVPPDGTYANVGCPGGHDLCRKCIIKLQAPSPDKISCYACRAVVNRPAAGWHPYPNNEKQDLLGHMQVSCCMDGCDAQCTIAELQRTSRVTRTSS